MASNPSIDTSGDPASTGSSGEAIGDVSQSMNEGLQFQAQLTQLQIAFESQKAALQVTRDVATGSATAAETVGRDAKN